MWNSAAFSEKRSKSRSQCSMQKRQYFEWGSTLNLDGFKIIIFQYIICEPFRYWKEGLTKLDVNLWEIWQKFKCRRSMSYPPWWLWSWCATAKLRGALRLVPYWVRNVQHMSHRMRVPTRWWLQKNGLRPGLYHNENFSGKIQNKLFNFFSALSVLWKSQLWVRYWA